MAKAQSNTEYLFAGVLMKCILTGEDTKGMLCLFENASGGNSGTPVHVHAQEDETLHVLEGEMQAVFAGITHTVRAGEAIFMPRRVPHQLKNTSGQASRYLIFCTPSGFEEFVAAAGRKKEPGEHVTPPSLEEIARMREAAPHFGITLLPAFEVQAAAERKE